MAVHYSTKGFVFKKEDRSEADRIFSVFTQNFGKIEIFAKAIRRITSKLKSGIEIFSFSELSFIQGKNRKTLTDTFLIEKFNHIAESPEKIAVCNNISFTLNDFIRGQEPDERIWRLIIETFKRLDNYPLSAKNHSLAYPHFFWNFISVLGYAPELSKCAACSQKLDPYNLYFSNKEGGVICQDCFAAKKDGLKINSDIVKILRIMLTNPPTGEGGWKMLLKLKIETSSQKGLEQISGNYRNYLLSSFFELRNAR